MTSPTIIWFRDDLRLSDNPALTWAAQRGPVVGLYVHETVGRPNGAAAAWWLRRSLESFRASLPAPLIEVTGDPREIVPRLARELGAEVTWNRRYRLIDVDKQIKAATDATSHPGFLLAEPWQLQTDSGTPFRVFTPFHKAMLEFLESNAHEPFPIPDITAADVDPVQESYPDEPDWAQNLDKYNSPGEETALSALDTFLDAIGHGRAYDNDMLDGLTSGLSPHLRFGEISPATIWHQASEIDAYEFQRQLVWRDFAWHRYYHLPDLATQNVREKFNNFAWAWTDNAVPGASPRAFASPEMDPGAEHLEQLSQWQQGQTGIPLVDAAMRELWATGRMSNRVRMVTGSWLTKNLGIHWRHGEEWFWDTLVDADYASNPFNWQWVAGSGDDAAPYFRVFNPLLQADKFDPNGTYVSRWVPELHTPMYPEPMVDPKESRKTALAAYDDIKND